MATCARGWGGSGPNPSVILARIAPTPSGYLHLGNAVNFAANALLAERYCNGNLLLRIDDLDRARFRPEYLQDVFEVLDWLRIRPTQGPVDAKDFTQHWSQEQRLRLYGVALDKLSTCGPALFACPCSRKQLAGGTHAYDCPTAGLPLDRPGVAWRIDTRGTALHARMPDFAVRKKDGRPSYQLACTVDDLHFGVTHCARGEDLRDSTMAQTLVSDLLGYPPLGKRIHFIHHPLLTEGAAKLSKRQHAPPLRETGVSRQEVFALARDWLAEESS